MRKLKIPLAVWLSYIGFLVISLLLATILPFIVYNGPVYRAEIHFTGIYKEIYDISKLIVKIPPDQFYPITTVLISLGLFFILISSISLGPILPVKKLNQKNEKLIVDISRFIHVTGSLAGIIGASCFISYMVRNELLVFYHFSTGFIFYAIMLGCSLLFGIFTIFFVESNSKIKEET